MLRAAEIPNAEKATIMSVAEAYSASDYAVKDIGLAQWGRTEMTIA